MTPHSILVIGGSGFIGSHVVAKLAAAGHRIIVPTHRYEHAKHLLPLPTVDTIVEADVHDLTTLNRLMRGVDAVINLVGILHDKPGAHGSRYGLAFAHAHVELPKKIVAACIASGVRRYLHMSALGAAQDAPSMYLRSKAEGEAVACSNSSLATTVFRPSVVFGREDRFLNLFVTLQKYLPVMLLGRADAKFQPVYVEDVAQAFVNALTDKNTIGKTYELTGPNVYTLRELVRFAGLCSRHPRPIIALPDALAYLQAWILELLPGNPLMSRDNLDSMKVDSVASGKGAYTLKMPLTSVEAMAPYYSQAD